VRHACLGPHADAYNTQTHPFNTQQGRHAQHALQASSIRRYHTKTLTATRCMATSVLGSDALHAVFELV
jgi:hypothetical protein